MQRRSFIKQSVLWTAGCAVGSRMSLWGTVSAADEVKGTVLRSGELYKLFRDPQSIYRPFVRWWWNGDKVEADELKRELHILKEAGRSIRLNFPAMTRTIWERSRYLG